MEFVSKFIETLSQPQQIFLKDLVGHKFRKINWDLDEVLSDTQTPVKERFFNDTGIDFRHRKIDQWLALANWAKSEKALKFEDISVIEARIWANPEVLALAQPYEIMREFSRLSSENGVIQTVTTSRTANLSEVTYAWLEKYFPWIDKQSIYIRQKNDFTNGDIFKGVMVGAFQSNAHFDDSISSVTEVLRLSSATVIFFPRNLERDKFKGNERVIEFPDMDLWTEITK